MKYHKYYKAALQLQFANVSTDRSLAVFKLPDSANYFLSHWHRILDKDFLPLGEDIVRWVSLFLTISLFPKTVLLANSPIL